MPAERVSDMPAYGRPPALPVVVHPNLAEAYGRRIAELESPLEDPELCDEAMVSIRSMIERIVVTPRAGGGIELELHGDRRGFWLCAVKTQNPASFLTRGF